MLRFRIVTDCVDRQTAMSSATLANGGCVDLKRPFIWTLPLARRTLLFADLSPNDIAGKREAFLLVSDAARRADNVGTDEIPSLEYFDKILGYADDVIAIHNVDSTGSNSAMVGLLAVFPCRYVRSCHPSNCSLFIVTGESISSRLVWRDLARLGYDMGIRGNRGYTGCTIDVFVTSYELVASLRDEGFVITAFIPEAGLVNGHPGRHTDSYVMYKELNTPPV
jgi:hypothetical protein